MPKLYRALQWSRNPELINLLAIMQTPMWLIEHYFEIRGVEAEISQMIEARKARHSDA